MPVLTFKKKWVEYFIPQSIVEKLVSLGKETQKTGLEKGVEFCSDAEESEHPTMITGLGKECTGTSCSIKVEDCGDAPSCGCFHTHALMRVKDPQRASYGDLLALLWDAKYTSLPGIGCRIGMTSKGLTSIQCDKVKVIPDDKTMDKMEADYDKFKSYIGEQIIDKRKYFYPTQEIEVDDTE